MRINGKEGNSSVKDEEEESTLLIKLCILFNRDFCLGLRGRGEGR